MRKEVPKDDGDEVKAEEEETKPEPEFDIEAEIAAEVKGLRKPTSEPLFTNVKVDVQCGKSTPSAFGHFLFLCPSQPVSLANNQGRRTLAPTKSHHYSTASPSLPDMLYFADHPTSSSLPQNSPPHRPRSSRSPRLP